ncbi:MAG: DUF3667 domain-containing protein [Chitinophagaceae bacterium]|nr:MAG: DUF3667 domain-containing protein [Chitinophagaceae bacterium]
MESICQNCNHSILENFCANCGQKKFKRIDKKYVLDEVQYSVIHTNKGFLYSAKKILKNPGKTAHEFIYGNRVNHYKPLLLLFLLSGVATFISFKIVGLNKIMTNYYASQHMNSELLNDIQAFMSSYSSMIILILVPFFSIFTKLVLRKWRENYYEHIIMNAYVFSTYNFLLILVLYPILYLVRANVNAFVVFTSLVSVSIPLLLVWFYRGFYPDKSLKTIIGKVLLIVGCSFLVYMLIIILTITIAAIVAQFTGQDILHYLRPQKMS